MGSNINHRVIGVFPPPLPRTFIHPQHHARFDALVSFTSTTTSNSTRRGTSHDMPRPLSSMGRYRSSMPNLATVGTRTERYVREPQLDTNVGPLCIFRPLCILFPLLWLPGMSMWTVGTVGSGLHSVAMHPFLSDPWMPVGQL